MRHALASGLLACVIGLSTGCGAAVDSPEAEDDGPLFYIITATPGPTDVPVPTPDLPTLLDDGLEAAQRGDGERALAALEEIYDAGATSQAEQAWVTVASTVYNLGEYEQAADVALAGVEHFPENTDLLFMGGKAALTLGDAETAIDLLGQAVDVDPEDYRAWHLRGVAHMVAGDAEQAIPDFEQAVLLGEESGVVGGNIAFQAMADLAVALAEEDPQAGLVYLAEKRGYYFNFEGILSGALLAGQGRIWGQNDLTSDAALDVLNRAIQRNYVEGYYYRAEVWARIGERQRAIRDLETYLDIRPVGLVSEWARGLLNELEANDG